jgi:hypothetical protein
MGGDTSSFFILHSSFFGKLVQQEINICCLFLVGIILNCNNYLFIAETNHNGGFSQQRHLFYRRISAFRMLIDEYYLVKSYAAG